MSLKIYFCGSMRGGTNDTALYAKLIEHLKQYGRVLTEVVGQPATEAPKVDKSIHDQDVSWLTECDVVVAEVTQPSLGVGYEIGRAVTMNKPILCLFRPSSGRKLSAMIAGADDGDQFLVNHYEDNEDGEAFHIIDTYFQRFKK